MNASADRRELAAAGEGTGSRPTLEQAGAGLPIVITVRSEKITPDLVEELKRILQAHRGKTPVHLQLTKQTGANAVRVNLPLFPVDPSPGLMGELKSLFGQAAITI